MHIYGIEIDSRNLEPSFSLDKVDKVRIHLLNMQCKDKTNLYKLQSLIGPLIFACSVFVPGRSFLRRLIDLTWGVKNQKALKILQTNRKQISIFGFCYCYSRENLYFILKIGFQEIIYYLFTDDSRAFCFCCCNGLQWFVSYWQESMKATKLLSKSCIQLVWPWRIGGGGEV